MLFSHSNSHNKKDRGLPAIQFYHRSKDQENIGSEARPTVWSLWFIFCIPLTWIFRVKLSKLHIFACRINHERKPEHQRFE